MKLYGMAMVEINYLYLHLSVGRNQGFRLLKLLSTEAVLKEKTWCMGPYAGVDHNTPYQLSTPTTMEAPLIQKPKDLPIKFTLDDKYEFPHI